MRIFGKLLPVFRLTRRISCSSIAPRRLSHCGNILQSPCFTNPRLVFTTLRSLGTKSGNSKFFNRKIGRSSRRLYDKNKSKSSDSLPKITRSKNNERLSDVANILPVALINQNNASSVKVLLIPINIFEGEDDAVEKTLATLSVIRDNARQIEAFTDNLPNKKFFATRAITESNKNFNSTISTNSKTPPIADTPILNEYDAQDDVTFWQNLEPTKEHGNSEAIASYDEFEQSIAEEEANRLQVHDSFDVSSWNDSKNDLFAPVSQSLEDKIQTLPISSMQLAFEMDMTNIKDALLRASIQPSTPQNKVEGVLAKPKEVRNLKEPTLALTTCFEVVPAPETKNVPLSFNALIQGVVEIDASRISLEELKSIRVPEFNECITAIAANICSTALKKGFPADCCHMSFSTKSGSSIGEDKTTSLRIGISEGPRNALAGSTPSLNKAEFFSTKSNKSKARNPHVVCVRDDKKGCVSPGNADNPMFVPSKSASNAPKNDGLKCQESKGSLMSCKAYANAIEEAAKRREASKKSSKSSCKLKKSPSKTKTSKKPSKTDCDKKPPVKKEQKKDCKETMKKSDSCKPGDKKATEKKKDSCKSGDKKPAEKKKDPCKSGDKKKDPCKSAEKKKDPCKSAEKKKDPCKSGDKKAAEKKKDPCKSGDKKAADKKKDPCKSAEKKKDPCKSGDKKAAEKKKDPCKSGDKKAAEKKKDPCKSAEKKKDPCKSGDKKAAEKKKDPCKSGDKKAAEKKKDPCKSAEKKKDPCKSGDKKAAEKKKDPCKSAEKKKDPCKSGDKKAAEKKKDPCKSGDKKSSEKKKDPCKSEKKKDPCKSGKDGKKVDKKPSSGSVSKKSACGSSSSSSKKSKKNPCEDSKKSKTPKCGDKGSKKASSSQDKKCEKDKKPKPKGMDPCKNVQKKPQKSKDSKSASKKKEQKPKSSAPKCPPPKGDAKCKSDKDKDSKDKDTKCPKSASSSGGSTKPNCSKQAKGKGESDKSKAKKPEKSSSKSNPCKSSKSKESVSKKSNPCKSKDTAKKSKEKSDPCKSKSSGKQGGSGSKKSDPCKSKSKEKSDPCKSKDKKPKSGGKKSDPCKKSGSKKNDPCKKSFSTEAFSKTEALSTTEGSLLKRCYNILYFSALRRSISSLSLRAFRLFSSKDFNQDNKCKGGRQKKRKRKDIKRRTKLTPCNAEFDNCPKKFCKNPPCGQLSKKKTLAKCKTIKACKKIEAHCYPGKHEQSDCPSDKKENKNFIKRKYQTCTQLAFGYFNNSVRQFSTVAIRYKQNENCEDEAKLKKSELNNEILRISDVCQINTIPEVIPKFSEYDVLIRTDSVAISETDLHVFETGGKSCPGVTLGHDASGIIVKVGKCIQNLKPNDRVVIESGLSCGICDFCKRGEYNICSQMIYNGFLAKYQVHPADLCHKLPDSVSMEEGCLAGILALGCNACYKAPIKPTSNVLVIGSCPTAISAALCCQAIGANRVCFACTQDKNLELIQKTFDFDCVCYEPNTRFQPLLESIYELLRSWPDVVINCAISGTTMDLSIMSLLSCGTCVLAKCDSECASFNAMEVLMKNLRIVPSFRSTNMFPTALQLMDCGLAPMGELIAECYNWEAAQAAFQSALHQSNIGNMKVIVKCADGNFKETKT